METCDSAPISRQENGQSTSKLCGTTQVDNEVPEKVAGMESDRENSSTDDNLKTDERKSDVLLGFGVENAAAAQVTSAKEIPCNECATSFPSLQKYMEHHCPNARLPVLKDDNESEVSELEDSDVENLTGEIVYQPDGSAYIIEDSKESGQNAQTGANSKLFSAAVFLDSLAAAGEKGDQAASAPVSFYPQIINTFHIASSLGKTFTADQAFPNTSALAGVGPVLHSFRVYDLRHKREKDYLTSDGSAKNSCVSKDVPNNVDLSKFDGCVSDGKRKPVLMCFLCKLSFGYIRSFVTHAVHDHRMTLNDEEQKLLGSKCVSAIIQGIGKDKEPLISFLEPKKSTSVYPHFSTPNLIGPDPTFRGVWSAFHVENGDSLPAGFAFLKGSAGAPSPAEPPRGVAPMPKAEVSLGALSSLVVNAPLTSVSLSHAPSESCKLSQSQNPEDNGDRPRERPVKSEPPDAGDEDDDDAYSNDLDDEEVLGELADSVSNKDFSLLNQSISPLSSSVLKFSDKGASCSAATASDDADKPQQQPQSAGRAGGGGGGGRDFAEAGAGEDGAGSAAPGEPGRGDDDAAAPPHQHGFAPSAPSTPGPGGDASPGSGVECPKCDTVLGSSRSLGGHMTMMHSRNSCKTLKCPKCNWHYKYQQTLEAHMKEKHPEPGGSCVYCKTGQPHPRLARGESYTCGYKPFRCEVCNYSTTTKGNLSIHMQSDKHLNNVQNLQNGNGEQVFGHSAPAPNASLGGCGTPSPSKPKQKPTWRCEVCDYETNVARNLRIHMTSEKHMHNMMLLQQNMKQIQHNLHLGLAPAEAELYQYYLAQNIGLTGMKLENPADAQLMINPFQLDPATAAALAPGLGELSPYISDPALKLFQCAVCNKFTSDSLEALSVHVSGERSLPEEEWRAVIGDIYQCKLCNYNTQLKANFQLHCKTDKHMQKYQLVAHIKEGGKSNEWRLKCIAIGNPVHLKCNACDYYTNSVDKLRLHTTNHRHEAALKLYKHLQKQESAVNPESCYYYCAVCDYSTKVKLNLVQHVRSVKHQQTAGLRKLQLHQQGLAPEEDNLTETFFVKDSPPHELETASLGARACEDDLTEQQLRASSEEQSEEAEGAIKPTSVAEEDEKDSSERETSEGKTSNKDSGIITPEKELKVSVAGVTQTLLLAKEEDVATKRSKPTEDNKFCHEQFYQCPYCNYNSRDQSRIQMHVLSQHSVQPVICCPLCQDVLSNKMHLQLHLTHLHSVSPDCVEKLLMTVPVPDVMMPNSLLLPAAASEKSERDTPAAITAEGSGKYSGDSPVDDRSMAGLDDSKASVEIKSEEQKPTKEPVEVSEWNKTSSKDAKPPEALQEPLSEQQKRQPLSVSERHVYKFRCNHCSLAFKTMQKLQIHSQYHAIRAATMCNLCQRSFRTFQALKKHLEAGHPELSEAELQQLYASLPVNGELWAEGETVAQDEHALEQEMEREYEVDHEGKASPIGSDSSSIPDDMGSEPKRTLPFRKGPNFTMEKFLDPSRPYKCTVCKESFTQKNILLVHYNSVSHLHKLKKVLQEASSPVPPDSNGSADNKPYKCGTCNVAYSQSSTLEIHMRSVLHQTKARAAKLEPGGPTAGGHGIAANVHSPGQGVLDSMSLAAVSSKDTHLDAKELNKKQSPDLLPAQPAHHAPQSPAQIQMQLQHELQQQAAFFQPQFLNPAFLPHFPMTPEALLQFQQPQFLFPFYIPGTEFSLGPDLGLPGSAAFGMPGMAGMAGSLLEDLKQQIQTQHHVGQTQLQILQQQAQQYQATQAPLQPQKQPPPPPPPPAPTPQQQAQQPQAGKLLKQDQTNLASADGPAPKDAPPYKDTEETADKPEKPKQDFLSEGEGLKEGSKDTKKPKPSEPSIPPPRIASGARGNAAKALLENFGFELVIQYNENRQKVQKKHRSADGDSADKLECGTCGKLFSNVLILKSHQEHVHGQFFPCGALEKFARQYREAYDKLYPISPSSPETPPPPLPPAPLPPAAPQPSSLGPGKMASTVPAPLQAPPPTPPPPPPPPPPPSAPPQVQLPVSLDLPLFPSIMMQPVQHPALPPQLALQLPQMDTLSADLTQLCQQQLGLDPNFLRHSQFKRPRTRITDDQLKILRAYFDINNSPSEEQIQEMAEKSGLSQKVIKHWFRNTLFKERQRNKDSPYNFSNPPITVLEDIRIDPQPSSLEHYKSDASFSKRSSRTRFTDYQLRVLQDFFDTNAYPKDDEIEQLSTVLNLPTRVIVVWFQNARQKARKSYENQAEAKDNEKRELTNERYIRTSNMQYQCKKCNVVFPRIFDLITHQKKQCYKDEDDDAQDESQTEDSMDATDQVVYKHCAAAGQPDAAKNAAVPAAGSGSGTSTPLIPSPKPEPEKTSPKPEYPPEKPKQSDPAPASQGTKPALPLTSTSSDPPQASAAQPQPPKQAPLMGRPPSATQTPVPSSPLQISMTSLQNSLPPQLLQYQCDQCTVAFPSLELWQEHQHMHFLAAQNQFLHSPFLERPMDMPYMIFDPNNPLMTGQLLGGSLSQMPPQTGSSHAPAPATVAASLKRKLDDKEDTNGSEKEGGNSGEDQHRDKRLRTTITPEQLEILYEKYLLDSNPTRKMLDHIAREVGLKKRVVQVWFQNTRARERKGQFRAVGPAQSHKRCPFCRALFKAKSALESHIRSRHWNEGKQAGYSLPPSPLIPAEDGGESPQKYIYFDYPSLPLTKIDLSSENELASTVSTPVSKTAELSPKNLLSPSSFKAECPEDVENLNAPPAEAGYDQNKTDFDETSSVNTAISDATTGDEGNAEMESTVGSAGDVAKAALSPKEPKTLDALPKAATTPTPEVCDEKFLFSLTSPSIHFNDKDGDHDQSFYITDDPDDNADRSETSSIADPSSPNPFGSSNPFKSKNNDRPGHKRFRTQMSNLQLKVLKACFSDYRTPTMQECEMLGNEIGLPKRVVQVWFQNARAKEKKFKINIGKPFMINQSGTEGTKPECALCGVKYSARLSIRDHIFSKQHISKVRETVGSQLDREKDYLAPTTVRQLMAQQELDRIKKASDVLGLAVQQPSVMDSSALHGINLPAAYPGLPGLPPVLLPGMNGPPSLPGFPQNSNTLTPPGAGMLGFPPSAASSPALSLGSAPTKSLLQTPPPPPPPPAPSSLPGQQTEPQNKESEKRPSKPNKVKKIKEEDSEATRPEKHPKKEEKISSALSMLGKVVGETHVDATQLQALQSAIAGDPASLLGGQFLPYFFPGFASYFTPQLPGAVQGGYLPPVCGVESLFPYGPAMPQTLAGLSPGSLLQQYQQTLQDSLQKQQKQQQQQDPPPKPAQAKTSKGDSDPPPNSSEASESKEDKGTAPESTKEEPQLDPKSADFSDTCVVPFVKYEFICRKCQMMFTDEDATVNHQKSFCYFGQPLIDPQETVLRVPVSRYQCLACDVAISGNQALSQHLQSSLHKEKTIKQAMRNAKEHVRLLPHSVCPPDPSTTSTSQSAASSNNTYPHLSCFSMKSWPDILFQASARRAASSPSSPPSLSLPSTVTSSLCSTSGVQTSLPTESCSDESDSELSQKLEDLDNSLEVKAKPASGLDGNFNSVRMDMFSV
ncbi:zinc finger homeobox protein 4 isoform X6 [Pteropus vampyrus]|uniref:Zinc finger homeobox protein 4 n=1 Tax=Pteropus vampyrus TaxID=132908 RepID=A0A6P6BPA1_PTEVA|nr:zinc finger homeobox protein 4 isoform X6 [Pteropus vampyrus]